MIIRKDTVLYFVIFVVILARMYHVAFYLRAGDPQRYIELTASAPSVSFFIGHFLSNFDPLYWIFLYSVGSISEHLLLPLSALFFALGYISVINALNVSRTIALVVIVLIMLPFNSMGNFICGALRQTFAMSFMLIAIFNNLSIRRRSVLIFISIFSHSAMVLVFLSYLSFIFFDKMKLIFKSKHTTRYDLRLFSLLLLSAAIFFPTFENIVNNKLNHYSEISLRESVSFGYDKLFFIILHVCLLMYPYRSRSVGAIIIGRLALLMYLQAIILIFIDTALSARVFNSVYYLTFILFCCVTIRSVYLVLVKHQTSSKRVIEG